MFFLANIFTTWNAPAPPPVAAWRTPPERGTELLGAADGLVFSSSTEGTRAVDIHTGQTRWHRADLRAHAAPAGDLLLGFADEARRWHAVDTRSGQTRWLLPEALSPYHAAVQGDGVMFVAEFRSGDAWLMGLAPETGALLWKTPIPEVHAVEATHGLVVLASAHEVIARDGRTGEPRWRYALPEVAGCTRDVRLDVRGDEVLFSPDCTAPLRLDAVDGHLVSALDGQAPFQQLRADTGGMLLRGKGLTALTPDGQTRWHAEVDLFSLHHTAQTDDALWGIADQQLTRIDLHTGAVQPTGWHAQRSVPMLAVQDEAIELVVQLPDGSLAGIDTDPPEAAEDWTVRGTLSPEVRALLGDDGVVYLGDEVVEPDADGRFSVTVPDGGAYLMWAPALLPSCDLLPVWITGAHDALDVTVRCLEPC